MPVEMKLQHVPASRGATWVRQGFRAFALRPLAFMALLFTYTFASLLLFQLPWLGLVALACPPLLALVFMIGTQLALNGRVPTPALFAAPFRVSRAQSFALAKLGVLFLLLSVGVVLLGHWADGGSLVRAMGLMSRQDNPAAQKELAELFVSPQLQFGVLLRFGLIACLMLLFAHASALVHWGAHGTAKSMFFSTVAVWRNKAAFVVYAITGFLVQMAFSMLTSVLFAIAPQIASLVMLVTSVVLATVFCTSLFFTFVDSFEASITPPAES